jgi:hypothetical protein
MWWIGRLRCEKFRRDFVMNFCTSSAHFAPSFVTQPNGPKCTQIVQNTRKHQFRGQWVGSGAFVAKNSKASSWHYLLHWFGPFCTCFVWQPNGPKCTQIVRNRKKHQLRVRWVGLGAFIVTNSGATSWHKLLH